MNRTTRNIACITVFGALLANAAAARADDLAKKIHDDFRHSLVAVKYTLKTELGRQDLSAAGVVVTDDGLVMLPSFIVSPQSIPEQQITDVKVIVPSDNDDETELDAVYQGRDERTNIAFVRTKDPRQWKSIKFVDVTPETGDTVYSIAMLPKDSGYRTNVTVAMISTRLRGPVPQYLVDGALAGGGGVVFDAKEEAIGFQQPRSEYEAILDSQNARVEEMAAVLPPSRYFVPSGDFLQSLSDPPTPDKPIAIPWMGLPEPKGLDKDLADVFGLKNVPSVLVGDIVKGSPAEKAGLKISDVIIKVNGQPLERGDDPSELPAIMSRKVQRMKVGDTLTLTVIHQKGDTPRDVTMTLEQRPKEITAAKRYFAEDIGLVVREGVFNDNYARKLDPDRTGVVVAGMKRQSAAVAAQLLPDDLILQMNGKPVTDLDQFSKDYEQFRKDKPNEDIVMEVSHVQDGKQATIKIEPPQGGPGPSGGM